MLSPLFYINNGDFFNKKFNFHFSIEYVSLQIKEIGNDCFIIYLKINNKNVF
ncbi:hypothetical protein DFQ07_0951 [Tenacibaculum caenipelagi]|uniref:Uncharacterized protein n=1 Tax=Tenacibaculum caenipelagi TaxID=1325435 RepID=A0A4R6TE67_9FLAO|nr:hypothetical protein DFQ07_0951 [Tenacibaculum caenipelagi]